MFVIYIYIYHRASPNTIITNIINCERDRVKSIQGTGGYEYIFLTKFKLFRIKDTVFLPYQFPRQFDNFKLTNYNFSQSLLLIQRLFRMVLKERET